MRDISAAADHYYDRMWDEQCEDEELADYLEERGITYEQHLEEQSEAEAEYAISQMEWE